MRKLSTALKIIVSVAILLFLFHKANLTQGIQHLSRLRYPFVLLSILLIVIGQVVRAQRLAVMVFGGQGKQEFWEVLRIQMVSFLPGAVSPAKMGEVAKIYMLRSDLDVPTARGLVCFAAERVLDLMLLGPLAAIGLFFLLRTGSDVRLAPGWMNVVILAIIALAAALLLGILWVRSRGISLADFWRTVSPESITKAGVLTLIYWGVVFLEVWSFCRASNLDAHVRHIALVVPPALLSSMIPITLSGFGLREAAMILLLQKPPIAANYEQALLVSLMYDIIGLGIPALMGTLFWLIGKNNGASQTRDKE